MDSIFSQTKSQYINDIEPSERIKKTIRQISKEMDGWKGETSQKPIDQKSEEKGRFEETNYVLNWLIQVQERKAG